MLDNTAKWTERLYSMTDDQIAEYFADCGKDCNKILYIEYYYYQIGKTEKWLEDISAKIGDKLTVRREILLQRLHGSSDFPYDQEAIEYIVETEQKPITELWLLDYFKFDVYTKLDPSIPYIVSVDCSTGTNSDNNAITVLNPYTVEPDAEFECSYIGETKYEQIIIELVQKHIPRAVVVIERNSIGDGIIDHLMHSPISNRLYFDKDRDLVATNQKQYETVESILKKQASRKSFYGVYTEGKSREDMFAILARHVAEYKEKFKTHNVIRDLSRLVKLSSGKIAAGPGFHDDSIMSYLIGLYVYYHGNNLAVFGINKGEMDLGPENLGMKRPEEIDPMLVDQSLINAVKRQEELNRQPDWEQMMKEALARSQKETYRQHQAGMVQSAVFENSPDVVLNQYDEDGSIDMDFFNTLNGF